MSKKAASSDLPDYRLKIITDEPTLEDALDFRNYSYRLADIITNSTPRFSIGIFGGWGTGKTSLMSMIRDVLDGNKKIVTVWFDAWRYEREEYLAVIPFLRTVKLSLDAVEKAKAGNWGNVKKGVVKAANIFSKMTTVTPAPGISFDLEKAAEAMKEDSKIADDRVVYYHVTDFLEKALKELRKKDSEYRIVIFIDDLDRCSPDKALEVLESIKSFFDLEGFVYVIGMDSKTINSLVRKKYGEDSAVEGMDYLQKIVQLPFQIPTWRETDISTSMSKIITRGLEGSPQLMKEFEDQRKLMVKAVELNPREAKRFINNVILAKAVFGRSLDELIVVQALRFRSDWNKFFELITPDKKRQRFLFEYKRLERERHAINNKKQLEETVNSNGEAFRVISDIYQELVEPHNEALRSFLEAGAAEILSRIRKMGEHVRALDTTQLLDRESRERAEISSDLLLEVLQNGEVERFNSMRKDVPRLRLDFSFANLSNANISRVNLSYVDLFRANLSSAWLVEADLSNASLSFADISNARLNGANLLNADLSGATLQGTLLSAANLSGANLSGGNLVDTILERANLSYSKLNKIKHNDGIRCKDCSLKGAIIDDDSLLDVLRLNSATDIPELQR
jgi:uncharacterized protein YjbI with pentapeptide repeats